METTLNKIKEHSPCEDGWAKLLKHLGKTSADDDTISVKTILGSNGIDDALWALRAVDGEDKKMLLMCADIAESVLHIYSKHYPDDKRVPDAIQAKRDFANDLISQEQYDAARDAAWDAQSAKLLEMCGEEGNR